MVYNSNADSQDIVSTVLDKAGATSVNVYPLKRITRNFNAALDMYLGWAFEVDGRWNFDDINETSPPIDTQNIVSGTNRYKLSAFTETLLSLMRLEILNSAGTGLYLEPERLDTSGNVVSNETGRISGTRGSTFQELYVNASSGTPTHYIKYGGFIYLRPNPNYSLASALLAYFNRPASYLASTDTTKVAGVPVIHHPLLCELTANQFKYDKKLMTLVEKIAVEKNNEDIVKEYFANRDKDIPKRMLPNREDNK